MPVNDSSALSKRAANKTGLFPLQTSTNGGFTKYREGFVKRDVANGGDEGDEDNEDNEDDEPIDKVQKTVSDNIKKKGLQMMVNRTKNSRSGARLQTLALGDRVRLESLALKKNRKLGVISQRSQKMTNWTRDIYTITHIVPTTDSEGKELLKYRVAGEQNRSEPEDGVSYYRNQIVKVNNSQSLVKIGRKKEDLTFGVKMGREKGGINRDQTRREQTVKT